MRSRLATLRNEDGAAVIIAMMVMLLVGALGGVLVQTAIGTLSTSTRGGTTQRALQAAQAGMNIALYRLAAVSQSPTSSFAQSCITDREATWSPATHCATTGALGNGATYTYYVSPQLSTSPSGIGACGTGTAYERCVTAVGTVNGVSRRIQKRVTTQTPLFPSFLGILGLKSASIDSSPNWNGSDFSVQSDMGTNGPLSFGNNATSPTGQYHCYFAPTTTGSCSNKITLSSALTLQSVDTLPFAGAGLEATLTAAQGYTAATRTLSVGTSATLSLPAGDYKFCSVDVKNKGTIIATSGRVRIFVDSPARAGSGCAAGSGTFQAGTKTGGGGGAAVQLNPGTGNPNLEIYVYGTKAPTPPGTAPPPTTCGSDVLWHNGAAVASSNVYIYAPNSDVVVQTGALITGAMAGCTAMFWADNPSGAFSTPTTPTPPGGQATVVPAAWRECTASATPVESNCNG
jgi:Tfp pilus assembly protein PilX